MKSIFTLSIFTLSIFAVSFTANAQTPQQREAIRVSMKSALTDKFVQDKDYGLARYFDEKEMRIDAYLKKYPQKLKTYIKDSKIHFLYDVTDDGFPIYYTTRDLNQVNDTKANQLQMGGSLGVNLIGTNMVAGVWDGGQVNALHEALVGRATMQAGQTVSSVGGNNHQQAVTAMMVGNNINNARGIAYGATTQNFDWDDDLTEMDGFAGGGFLISNHSYGPNNNAGEPEWFFGAYNNTARAWDFLLNTRPFYLPFVAGGNEQMGNSNPATIGGPTNNGGYDVMTAAAASKNAMVIGATDGGSTMSDYSNFGPTDDGRIKPDIVTRGTGIEHPEYVNNTGYTMGNGTSYSTPAAAAGALLLQEYYGSLNGGTFMKAAMLKALLCHSADDDALNNGPDARFGWGILNLEKAANIIKEAANPNGTAKMVMLGTNPTNDGIAEIINNYTFGPNGVRASLCWVDDPGVEQLSDNGVNPTTSRMVYNFSMRLDQVTPELVGWPYNNLNVTNPTVAAVVGDNWFQSANNYIQANIINTTDNAAGTVTIRKSTTSPAPAREMALIITGIKSTCPTFTAAPANVTIVNSSCNVACTVAGGSITAPPDITPCPAGSTLQYNVNNGVWSTTVPTYAQAGPAQKIQTRCNCNSDNTVSSDSTAVTTVPGAACTTPPPPMATSPQIFCILPVPTVASLVATGNVFTINDVNKFVPMTIIKWYANASGGMALPANTPLVNGTTYHASQTNANGCESTTRTPVMVTLNGACFTPNRGTMASTGLPMGFMAVDPCTCNNNSDPVLQNNGTFNEFIQVTGPTGATITGTATGGTPSVLTFTEVVGVFGLSTYTSNIFTHVDDIGYLANNLTAQVGAGPAIPLPPIGNKCIYPNVTINPIGPFPLGPGPNVPLTATINPPAGTSTWGGAGVTGSNYNPTGLPAGNAPITLSFDGTFVNNVSPDNGVTAANPGCIQTAARNVSILAPCPTPVLAAAGVSSTTNSVTVNITNATDVVHYTFQIRLGASVIQTPVTVLKMAGTTTTYTFSNLAPCNTYTVDVTALCIAGPSTVASFTVSTRQDPPVATELTNVTNFSCITGGLITPASATFRWTHHPSSTALYWTQIKNAANVVVGAPLMMTGNTGIESDTTRTVNGLLLGDLTRTLEVWSGDPALPTSCLLGTRTFTPTVTSTADLQPATVVEPVVMFDECLPMGPITDAVFTLTDCGGIDTSKITIRVNDSLFRRSVHLEPTYRAAILPGQGSAVAQAYTVDLLAMRPAGRYVIEFTYVDRAGNTLRRTITKELRKNVSGALAMTCISFQQWSLSDSCRTTGDTVKVTNMMTVPLCPEAYKVFFKGTKNLAILNKTHIGKTVTVEVLHEGSGQKCWGDIFVEDKVPAVCLPTNIPVFTISCDSVEIYKLHTATTTIRPAKVRDNCGLKDSVLTIHDFSTKCGGHLIRRWTYTDCGGMVTHCEQRINIVNNNAFNFPQDTILVECGIDVSPNGLYNYLRDKVFNNVTPTITRDSLAGRKSFVWIFTSGNRFGGNANDKCGLLTTWSDVEFTLCLPADRPDCKGTSRKILRKWDVIDWCTGRTTPRTQIIVSADTRPPSFKVDNITVSTRPWDCTADVWMPAPRDLHDNCDFDPRWTVKADQDVLKPADIKVVKLGDSFRATGVPCGTYKFKYIATDCCGNDSLVFMNVTVTDRTAPNAITKQDIVISLVPGYKELNEEYDAQAKLFATSVDNGSHDNCSPNVLLEVRRPTGGSCGNLGGNNHNNNRSFRNFPTQPATATTPAIAGWNEPRGTGANNTALFTANRFTATERSRQFYNENDTDGGAFVKFCCDDIPADADFGIHEVIMRVWDDGNKNGVVGDPGDNYNETWANVRVDCKVPPVISCPPNLTIPCDWEIPTSTTERDVAGFDFSKTKVATAYGACGVKPVRFVDKVTNGNCGAATIERTFIVVDKGYRVTCTQVITVTAGTPDWVFFNRLATSPETTSPNCPTVASGLRRINHYEHTIAPVPARTSTATTNTADLLNLACDIEKVTVCNLTVESAPVIAATPTYRQGPCDVIGLNKKIWEIEFEEGVCKKWVVDYKFVNWCDQKEITYRKMFVFEDLSAPKIVCQDTCIAAAADCKTSFTIRKSADDLAGCADITDRRWLKWQVFIDEWADGTVDRIYSSFVAPNWNFGTGQVINYQGRNVPAKYLAPSEPGRLNNGIDFTNIEGKHSFHNVTWKVTDGCHNYASCQETIEVRDKKAPTPYCVNLSTALMAVPAGAPATAVPMVELWAKDFDKASFDGCTPSKDLLFTFNGERPADTLLNVRHIFTGLGVVEAILEGNRTSSAAVRAAAMAKYNAGTAQIWIPATRSSGRVWTSAALQGKASNEVQVNVSVWDWALNTDFCMVNLKLVCNGNGCPTGTANRIAGNVHTEDGKNVMDVRITASASIPEYPKQEMTKIDGNFSMEIVTDTELKAEKDGDDINGVSTLDLVMLQRHILGLENLNSPYKLIAADANNDGKISAADITEIRKLILGLSSAFEYNSSWRFPIEKQFMNKDNPFPYLETMIARYGETDNKYNFMAVKIGDVNGNASSGIYNPNVESRNNNTLTLAVEEKQLAAGDVVEIPVTAANFNDVAGFQYTMNLKGASFAGINGGVIEISDNNVGVIAKDVITMSYANDKAVTVANDEVLFTIIVKADKAVKVSEMLSIGSAVTPAEAYNSDLKVGKVSLDVRTAPVTAIELMQNEPNPFKGQTSVSFLMPEAATATLSVFDVTGKVVSVRNINAVKGLNSELFTREQLGASGVMYYTLKSGDFTATKKMIIIE